MEPPIASSATKSWKVLALVAAVTALALLPWCRNHGYLRDFYDYGLVIAGTARIDHGERPYVDFTTPIQCGTFWFNALPEKIGGGTFQAMTLGGAALILLALPTLAWLLARRLAWWVALPVAAAVVVGSAAQHTIVWHNSLGVVCLALVACGSALAPVLRREDWLVHGLVGLALLVGGVNKLNFHLVALAVALAWLLRAILTGRATWRQAGGTLGFLLVAGVVAPVGAELLWTGASLAQWHHNVVALAAGSRTGYLHALATWRFYLEPPHNFYGPLLLPQVGLAALAILGLAGLEATLHARGLQRVLAAAATVCTTLASLALLATNHEIAYVGLAAALALAVALRLGFAATATHRLSAVVPVAIALGCGAVGWWSAWDGQRSQFGHSPASRPEYRDPSVATPALRYLRGTRIPPEIADSVEGLLPTLPDADAQGVRPVFYGPGFEWFERIAPAVKKPQLPLWLHEGTSYGLTESSLLAAYLASSESYRQVLVPIAWDNWPRNVHLALGFAFAPTLRGPVLRAYIAKPATEPFSDPLSIINLIGGNLHPAYLDFDPFPLPTIRANGERFIGRVRGTTEFRFGAPSNRMAGTVVVKRLPGAPAGPLHADFTIRYTRDAYPDIAWTQTVELPAGSDEATADYLVDARQQALRFIVSVPPECTNVVSAGWLGPRILHSIASDQPPATLYPAALPGRSLPPGEARAALPANWQPDAILLRGATVSGDRFEIAPGGELWLRADKPVAELRGKVHLAPDQSSARMPVCRLVWCKGGRIEILAQAALRESDRQLDLHAWSAEPEGWFGILIDPLPGTPPTLVHLDSARIDP